MISIFNVKRKHRELSEFQKRLDMFLQEENVRLEKELIKAKRNKDLKLAYGILLQMLEIMSIREKSKWF